MHKFKALLNFLYEASLNQNATSVFFTIWRPITNQVKGYSISINIYDELALIKKNCLEFQNIYFLVIQTL